MYGSPFSADPGNSPSRGRRCRICEVTRQAVEAADGGLWYEGYPLFEAALGRLENDEGLRAALVEQGRRYVTANFTWPRIVERYEGLLRSG